MVPGLRLHMVRYYRSTVGFTLVSNKPRNGYSMDKSKPCSSPHTEVLMDAYFNPNCLHNQVIAMLAS